MVLCCPEVTVLWLIFVQVPAEVSEELLKQLTEEMGFPANRYALLIPITCGLHLSSSLPSTLPDPFSFRSTCPLRCVLLPAAAGSPSNSRCRAIRALHATGTDNIEQAITWIVEHEGDSEIDEPLMVPKVWLPGILVHLI